MEGRSTTLLPSLVIIHTLLKPLLPLLVVAVSLEGIEHSTRCCYAVFRAEDRKGRD